MYSQTMWTAVPEPKTSTVFKKIISFLRGSQPWKHCNSLADTFAGVEVALTDGFPAAAGQAFAVQNEEFMHVQATASSRLTLGNQGESDLVDKTGVLSGLSKSSLSL